MTHVRPSKEEQDRIITAAARGAALGALEAMCSIGGISSGQRCGKTYLMKVAKEAWLEGADAAVEECGFGTLSTSFLCTADIYAAKVALKAIEDERE